ncbi:MAG: ExbD/TolR family protein [Planctomycetota bacterium]|jgi:biopolymer transport protein ExbD
MQNLMLWATLLAAPLDPAVELPKAPNAQVKGPKVEPAVVIWLTQHGRVVVDPGQFASQKPPSSVKSSRTPVGLDGLTVHLSRVKRSYDQMQKAKGARGVEVLASGVEASRLFVVIRADRRAPWRHVEWIMTICAEQKFYKTRLAVEGANGTTTLDAFLPKDKGIAPTAQEPVNEIHVVAALKGTKEKEVEWGPQGSRVKVRMPTGLQVRFGDREAAELAPFETFVKAGAKAAEGTEDTILVGQIRASSKISVQQVVTPLDWFRAQKYPHVHIWSAPIPSGGLRRMKSLPYPEKDEVPLSVGGSGGLAEELEPIEEELVEPR